LSDDKVNPDAAPNITCLGTVRHIVNQLFLTLSVASCLQGFASLSSVTLCFTQVIPFNLAVSIGFGLAGIFTLGAAITGLDMLLFIRAWRRKQKPGTKVSKEKISTPLQQE
jgi:hypothetical protein